MYYLVAIGVLGLAVYWLWGMGKMIRMNQDPNQIALVELPRSAGHGDDRQLLAFIREQGWNRAQRADRVAHALTLAERLFLADEYSRTKYYANHDLEDRCRTSSKDSTTEASQQLARGITTVEPNLPPVTTSRASSAWTEIFIRTHHKCGC